MRPLLQFTRRTAGGYFSWAMVTPRMVPPNAGRRVVRTDRGDVVGADIEPSPL